jgi:hypothetical protein
MDALQFILLYSGIPAVLFIIYALALAVWEAWADHFGASLIEVPTNISSRIDSAAKLRRVS